ncbi:MAG: methyltransferase domain-containing protein [Alphaproteobacteria bacterium]|nr:MAG: methyltransferase domain-containing protein [Alphaproteobacteria bacterium]
MSIKPARAAQSLLPPCGGGLEGGAARRAARGGAAHPHPQPLPTRGRGFRVAALTVLVLLAACRQQPQEKESPFPEPHRPVAPISSRYLNEDSRDSLGEFATVTRLADVRPRMFVADIGAGEGYYTVRLSPLVGPKGRVLAEDIVPETIRALGTRINRERLDNVAIRLGQANDPQLPAGSFDRVFLIHMYHEIARPSEFLWNLRAALKSDGRVIVVDADRPTDRHGTPQRLLVCEFNALGYGLTRFERLPDSESYFAQFEARAPRPEPRDIPACNP